MADILQKNLTFKKQHLYYCRIKVLLIKKHSNRNKLDTVFFYASVFFVPIFTVPLVGR